MMPAPMSLVEVDVLLEVISQPAILPLFDWYPPQLTIPHSVAHLRSSTQRMTPTPIVKVSPAAPDDLEK
jgi:hypothetical protein